jgi:predicted DNA-binding transcriptional regulator YafY
MKLVDAIRAMRLMPREAATAIPAVEFIRRWRALHRDEVSERTLMRWVADLARLNFIEEVAPPTVPRRYYRSGNTVSSLGMSTGMALRLVLSDAVLPGAMLGGPGAQAEVEVAESVLRATDVLRELRRRVAVLPDGIGRQPAQAPDGVEEAVAQAVGRRRVLRISYQSRPNMLRRTTVTHDLSVQAVVAKDGSTYLVACKAQDDLLAVFAVHRIRSAAVLLRRAIDREGFDLQRYIADTHGMSFTATTDPPVELKLLVNPGALWHFDERPLSVNQRIARTPGADGRHSVTAVLPLNEMLVPFLLSLGGDIEVVAPPEVRADIARRAGQAAAHYAPRR